VKVVQILYTQKPNQNRKVYVGDEMYVYDAISYMYVPSTDRKFSGPSRRIETAVKHIIEGKPPTDSLLPSITSFATVLATIKPLPTTGEYKAHIDYREPFAENNKVIEVTMSLKSLLSLFKVLSTQAEFSNE